MSNVRTLVCDHVSLQGLLGPWLSAVISLQETGIGARSALSRLEHLEITIADFDLTGELHANLFQRTECLKELSLTGQPPKSI